MAYLTLENLDPINFGYYEYSIQSRGRTDFLEGKVTVVSFEDTSAACVVASEQGPVRVTITAENKKQVNLTCECPQSKKAPICRHMIASILALRHYVSEDAQDRWQYRLGLALENIPHKKKAASGPRTKYAVVFGLTREKWREELYLYKLLTYRIKSTDWPRVQQLAQLETQEEKNELLEQDHSWAPYAEVLNTAIDPRALVNLAFEGAYLYNLLTRSGLYSYSEPSTYLPLLAKLDAPFFLVTGRSSFKRRLQLLTEPGRLEAALVHQGKDLALHAGLNLNGEIYSTTKNNLQIISADPAWAMAGRYVLPVENPEALSMLSFFPLVIPAGEEEEFREKFWPPIVESIPVHGDVVSWVDVDCDPIPRLYLKDGAGGLRASLRFGYGEHEVEANPKAGSLTTREIPDSWAMLRVHRRPEQEERFTQQLSDLHSGLKRSPQPSPPGSFELRARTHPFDFLLYSIPILTKAGFEIYGEETLKAGKINRATPSISLNITSGLDWFDIEAVVRYGDQQVSLQDVRRALRKKERYVKLADGSIGQIPETWLERYKKLFDLAEESASGLRVRDFHLPLVDSLLEDAGELVVVAREFQERRQRLGGFERIEPQPVPAGFTGELRPYQKAGLDWLHFLHQYGFGGCLADDMGLGKTIQVLAFLQSLKEQGKHEGPALLVVPKSLLTNWTREAERFTPGLRILEFMGNVRKKDAALFAEYDIVLTTYGTMLRDIEFLHGCPFQYAILDKSQAIKNPLAQSSKATRLLNAKHRLVMTGTPVENNTFELWAQFAFLNPGLLGSMDYFNREFANLIENRQSEVAAPAAQMLRRLVYPFILRRTKEQVAQELPERTERVLYTDMEPGQRKLYNHTRDYYRGLLMGLLDDEGINDVRMKILEGLLRLRQICIHPKLVDPRFHGESAKFELLLETLDTLRGEGHKALVFSQFVQALHLLRAELDARQIRYTYLDGQTNDRQAQVDTFQNDPSIPFFLISLKAGGVGLNLTAADYVIHIDPWWNPAVEMQAADRAHRIGQDRPVFIYKMIARDSVEEKILKLQEHKKELVDQIIAAEGSFFKSITPDDVKVLFS